MQTLLIVAHGSRRAASNDEIAQLALRVASHPSCSFDSVKVAFLELALPSIQAAIDECFQTSTSDLLVLPYFLSAGKHVSNDVPLAIKQALAPWPNKRVRILPHIGSMDLMVDLIQSACNIATETS